MPHATSRFLLVLFCGLSPLFVPAIARAGFGAHITDKSASPDPVSAGNSVTLEARIWNAATTNSGYNGRATYRIIFDVTTPGQSGVTRYATTHEFQHQESEWFSCRHRTTNTGTYRVLISVMSPSGDATWNSASFSFRAETADPCAGRSCRDSCEGDDRLTSGSCVNENGTAACAYLYRTDCHNNDFGQCEQYCEWNDVYSRYRGTSHTCNSGSCVGNSYTSDRQYLRTCGNTCDGNVRVLGQSCSNGQCVGGFRTDCDAYDQAETTRYCSGNEVWERRRATDAFCRDGTCAERQSDASSGLMSCGTGCNPATGSCFPDPCLGVSCENACDGDVFSSNGRCVSSGGIASCVYTTTNCNAMDTLGERRKYCFGSEVHSHKLFTDFSCTANGCSSRVSWSDDQLEDRCADACEGTVSVTGRTCVDGQCAGLMRTDCAAQNTPVESVSYCDGNALRAYDQHMEFSCVPMLGWCGDGRNIQSSDRLVENCVARAPTKTLASRRCDLNGHPIATYTVAPWVCRGNACASGGSFATDVDEGPCALTERCDTAEGRCIPCVSAWMCSEWSACAGQAASTRQCVDVWQCSAPSERPPEIRDCPCEVTGIRWEDRQGSEIAAAEDGEAVTIAVAHRGQCADACAPLEIWNVNLAAIPDDGPGSDDRFRFNQFCLGHNEIETTQAWTAAFRSDDWFGFNHFKVKMPAFRIESRQTLEVKPFHDTIGPIEPFLRQYPPSALATLDERECLRNQMETITVTDRCLALWKSGGAIGDYNTRRSEETLQDLVEFFIGDSTAEFSYFFVCTWCGVSTPPAAAVCSVTRGTGCVWLAAELVCDYGCLMRLGRYLEKVAAGIWKWFLQRTLEEKAVPYLARGYQVVGESSANSLRSDFRHQTLRATDGSTVDQFAFQDRLNPGRMIVEQAENAVLHEPGWNHYVDLNTLLKRRFGKTETLFRNAAGLTQAERRLRSELFLDDALKHRLSDFFEDLSAARDPNPYALFEKITSMSRVTGAGSGYTFGQTTMRDGINIMELGLRDAIERFGARAAQMIRSVTIPHEIGHGAAASHATQIGETLAPAEQSLKPAIEYLNDVYVLRHLRSSHRSEFAELKSFHLTDNFLEADGTLKQLGQDFVNNFVSAVKDGRASGDEAYELARLRALADTFRAEAGLSAEMSEKMARLPGAFDRAVEDRLRAEPTAIQGQIRQVYANTRTQLAADGEIYSAHLMDSRYDSTNGMRGILCTRYRYLLCEVGSSQNPFSAGDAPERFDGEKNSICQVLTSGDPSISPDSPVSQASSSSSGRGGCGHADGAPLAMALLALRVMARAFARNMRSPHSK